MTDKDLLNENTAMVMGKLYEQILAKESNEDYAVNKAQMQKLVDVWKYFIQLRTRLKGKVEPIVTVPKERHGHVTATFPFFGIGGKDNDIQEFCEAMSKVSAIGLDATNDGVSFSVTIPNIYVRKNEQEKGE